jgi:hypothetical protein
MSYPDSEQQPLIVKSLISSIDSAPFYLLSKARMVQKKYTINVPLIKSKDCHHIAFDATLFLNKDNRHYVELKIAQVWDDYSDEYIVKLPIEWKLKKPEDNVITVCVALRDALYEFFRKAPLNQQPFLEDWNYVGEPIFVNSTKITRMTVEDDD